MQGFILLVTVGALAFKAYCAHFVTYSYYQEKAHSNKVRLAPSAFDYRYHAGLIDQKEYTFNDLKMASESFQKLAKKIMAFWKKIPELR